MRKSHYLPYLRTLRRVPDDIILSVATRDLDLDRGDQCICGWAIREAVARATNMDAEDVSNIGDYSADVISSCVACFGGERSEWRQIYWVATSIGTGNPSHIERAFVERVMEAAS